ncbi:filamentous hemagglutinin N-terminal domain-containing protein [Phormidium sp. LEGE 05292]|uniref:two-partner secretion domain-containing protein n=1 Tax=[Phormidium] sp. LEGE 05292 TaxID=767427 RepID=UPI00187F7D0D|nr:filamentous hemagglutinin N-terminal domain-containing protein [Phormidium sp. LEGE 05292]MBE9224370.1 filamentous hemagglutinin N-terminal domain-containing protein [Phormidium sp. LEGE 05292]
MEPYSTESSYPTNRLFLITIIFLIWRTNQEPKILKIDRQKILLACCFFLLSFSYNLNQVQAQIVPDATVNTIVTPNGKANIIEGGTRAGNNLFHSFREFSVPTGGEAFFNNALNIRNIFSRVTGSSISNIDGLIRANGTANLFLLNPNGILFGPNAKLNIGGSFFASTANSIKFNDGLEFAANNLQSSPLLSVNVPIGLQYGKSPEEIRIQGNTSSSLEVLPGKSLTILGGNVTIDGGILQAPGGSIELGGISTEGTIGLNNDGSLSFPDNLARADVSIINQAQIGVQSFGGGSITVKARNLDISGESVLLAGIATGKGSPESVAGDILLDATDAITITSSNVENTVEENAIGNSKTIAVNAKSLTLTNGAVISTSTSGKGNAGDIKIVISDRLSLDGENSKTMSGIFATVFKTAQGEAGDISITTNSLSITNGGIIGAGTLGFGKAGAIAIQANDISLDGEGSNYYSAIVNGIEEGGTGDGRGITINTKTLTLTNGAQINASTLGKGKAGRITINASESVSFDGQAKDGTSTGAFGYVGENADGEANGITINTKSLTISNGAQVNASTLGKGNAGDIQIVASDRLSLNAGNSNNYTGIFATVKEIAQGEAGDISISTNSLSITNGALIGAGTFGLGKAGEIAIQANDISLDGEGSKYHSAIISGVQEGGAGNGRDITINTKTLTLTNGAQLNASTLGKGEAGRITINASESISFDGQAKDGTPTGAFGYVGENAEGKANNIEITTRALTLTNGARIDASTFGNGKAGSITIVANTINLDGETKAGFSTEIRSGVGENATGEAGGINITTNSLSVTNGAQLNANTLGKGDAGSIKITASDRVFFDGTGNQENPSGAFSILEKSASGKAGGVSVTSNSLTISNGAQLNAGTLGDGDAGSVTINTNNLLLNNGGSVATKVGNQAKGDPGDLNIVAGRLLLDNQSFLTAASEKGDGGNINIQSRDIQLRHQSEISAVSALDAKQGNIDIATRTLVLLEASQIRTDADAPNGGSNITIKPIDNFGVAVFVSPNSVISASGNLSIQGYIQPQSSDVPQVEVIDATNLVASTCRPREGEQSEFIVTGKGGLPPNPNEPIINDVTWVDLRPINLDEGKAVGEQRSRRIEEKGKAEIVEAQGWLRNANGEVVLVAQTAKAVPHKLIFNPQYCHD